jgi:hypothetical protein
MTSAGGGSTRYRSPLLFLLLTVPALCRAHPDLVETSLCGDAAHPLSRHHHGAPVHDSSISFLMSWAAPGGGADPQPNENDPDRRIPQVRQSCRVDKDGHGGKSVYATLVSLSLACLLPTNPYTFHLEPHVLNPEP